MRRPLLDQTHLSEQTQMVLLGMGTGVVVGYAAVFFIVLVELMEYAFFGEALRPYEILRHVPWYRVLIVPALGGLAAGLVIHLFAREARGHGVSEVMEAVALQGGVIRGRVGVVKTIASALTLGSGGSVGREGPIVQIGASIASKIGQVLGANPRQLRTLAGCGASAGIGAIFNAPIAGAIFSLEVILGDFELATFAPIVLAAVMGTAVAQSRLGNFPSFEAPVFEVRAVLVEIPFYLLVGILAGLVATLFIKALAFSEDRFEALRLWTPLKPALGGLAVGAMGIAVPWVLGGGYTTMTDMLFGRMSWTLLALLVGVKLLATCVTVGSGGSGGTFAPALFIGAALGGVVGHGVEAIMPGYTAAPGMYALIGMGALLAGTAQAPLTALLMAFEVTNNYQTILPVMLACAISAIIARRYAKESVYTMKLARRGINLRLSQDRNLLRVLTVGDAMTRDVRPVPETMKFGDLLDLLAHSRQIDFPVVDASGRLTGVISFQDIREVAFEKGLEEVLIVRELMSRNLITVTERDDLHTALERIGSRNIERLPVVDVHERRRLVGMLSRRDIVTAYNRAIDQLRAPPPETGTPSSPPVPVRTVEDDDMPG